MLGSICSKTVQVHVSRTCNLSCRHCYSLSGPDVRESIPLRDLVRFLRFCVEQGYESVSFSGGEPLVYPEIEQAVLAASELGLRVSMVTNGLLLDRPVWANLSQNVDVLAVSIDGLEEQHDHIRNSKGCLSRVEKNLKRLRKTGESFGIIHTVTAQTVDSLSEIADFAFGLGATLLQLHPLGRVGAADSSPSLLNHTLDGEAMARVHVIGRILQSKFGPKMKVHVDLFNRELVKREPNLIYATKAESCEGVLSEYVNPLVVMANGDVNPICHGIHRSFRMGNIVSGDFEAQFVRYRQEGYFRFREFCSRLFEEICPTLEWPYFNWYECFERATHQADFRGRFLHESREKASHEN